MKKQLNLFGEPLGKTEHGGQVREGKRKIARPIVTKKPMHLVLRSTRASGEWGFFRKKNREAIEAILKAVSERYGIRIIGFENVGNHLHLLIQGKSRPLLQAFLRTLPAKIAFAITGAKKGNPQRRFFDSIVFTRVVHWGRDILRTKNYLFKNQLEAAGVGAELIASYREIEKMVAKIRSEALSAT